MSASKRVTQQDIADRAGLNRATVSLALRNHSVISPVTRERVKALAEEMGYRPDPMLSALAAYRNSRQTSEFQGTLGWLARTTDRFQWRSNDHFLRYLAGATRKADKLGYRLEVIDLAEEGIRWERAASIASARGIQGVLLCPQPDPDTKLLNFPWQDFSAVTFGNSITDPLLQSVAPAQFRAAQKVVAELRARGYERIGFVGTKSHDERTGCNYFGGYLSAMVFDVWQELIPPFWFGPKGEGELIEWFKCHRPDAILASMEYHYQVLFDHGFVAPCDFGVACPASGYNEFEISGVKETDERIGEVAVEILVSMIHRGECGVPANSQRLLVEGDWVEGATLRERPSEVAPPRS